MLVALFPDLPTIKFFDACSMQWGRPGSFCHINDVSVYLSRQRGAGVLSFSASNRCFELVALGQKLQEMASSSSFQLVAPPPIYLLR